MTKQNYRIGLVILNLIGIIGALVVNALANILPINGKNTGQLSDQYPNLFVPAGITFAIWGVIYILLIIFIIYQFVILAGEKDKETTAIEKMGVIFFISCCANAGWIFAWHYEIVWLSLVIILVFLVSLILLYRRLGVGAGGKAGHPVEIAEAGERYCIHLTISVYLGWITVATIANLTAFLVSVKLNGFGLSDESWAILAIAVGIVLSIIMLVRKKDIFYALVVDWAFVGILIKRVSNNPSSVVGEMIAVIAGIAIISGGILLQIRRKKVY